MQNRPTSSYILVTLPNATLRSALETVTGTLSLECINSPPTHTNIPKDDREAFLVLHVEGRSFPIDPAIPISISVDDANKRTYTFRPTASSEKAPTPAEVTIVLAEYTDDVDTMDSVLAQYADVSENQPQSVEPLPTYGQATGIGDGGVEGMHFDDPALRGRLVLMDENSGEIVGELPQKLSVTEDPALSVQDNEKKEGEELGPVVVELPADVYDAYTNGTFFEALKKVGDDLADTRDVFVRAIPPEEQNWLTRSATVASHVISSSTSLLLTGITSASSYYIKHSNAYTPPPPSDPSIPRPKTPTAHPALAQAHALSDKAAKASAVTATYVEKFIRKAVGAKDKTPSEPTPGPSAPSTPPLPTTYSVYKPKVRQATGPPPLPPRSKPASPETSPPPSNATSPNITAASSPQIPSQPPSPPPRKPVGTKDRILMSANLVLATVDDSAKRVFDVSSDRLGAVIGHKYGPQAQQSTHHATHTARNVVLVYVDVSGFARRALLTKAGKEWVKTKVGAKHVDAPPSPPQHPSAAPVAAASTDASAAGGWTPAPGRP